LNHTKKVKSSLPQSDIVIKSQLSFKSMSSFNATVFVSEQMIKSAQELAIRSIMECANRYHFDAEEAINALGLRENVQVLTEVRPNNLKNSLRAPKVAPKSRRRWSM